MAGTSLQPHVSPRAERRAAQPQLGREQVLNAAESVFVA